MEQTHYKFNCFIVKNINIFGRIFDFVQILINDLVRLCIRTSKLLCYDNYFMNFGSFGIILIYNFTNETNGEGLIFKF